MTAKLASDRTAILAFLVLLLALSIPFWLLAQAVQAEPLPGLPLSGLMAFAPAFVAVVLVGREGGAAAASRFLARSFDVARMRGRLAWALLLLVPPLDFLVLAALPHPAGPGAPLWAPLAMLAAFFVAALGEELGWSGYLLERIAARWGELAAGLAIGLIWAAWHVIPFLQADRTWDWIAWQCLKTVAVRVVMVRLYFGAGRSVFAVALFHALDNVAAFLLPAYGAVYDPRLTALGLVALAALLTVLNRRREPAIS